jgi:hypothetical protein
MCVVLVIMVFFHIYILTTPCIVSFAFLASCVCWFPSSTSPHVLVVRPFNLVDRPELVNLVSRLEPANLVARPESANIMDRSYPATLVARSDPATLVDRSDPANPMTRPANLIT